MVVASADDGGQQQGIPPGPYGTGHLVQWWPTMPEVFWDRFEGQMVRDFCQRRQLVHAAVAPVGGSADSPGRLAVIAEELDDGHLRTRYAGLDGSH